MRRGLTAGFVVLVGLVACVPPSPGVVPFDGVSQLSAGMSRYSCLVTIDGEVFCWGLGRDDRDGTGAGPSSDRPVRVEGWSDIVEVRSGGSTSYGQGHVCALAADGTVSCVGEGFDGQLGNGVFGNRSEPQTVVGLSDAVEISVGSNRSCAIRSGGSVECWGAGVAVPTAVAGISDAATIDQGSYGLCVVDGTGDVNCPTLGVDPGISGATQVSVQGANVCAVLVDASVECAGSVVGEVGTTSSSAVAVDGLPPVARVDVSDTHACAALVDGGVWCWGANDRGQAGGGGTTVVAPRPVPGVAGAVDVSVGEGFSCARLDSTATCWGLNGWGELGAGFETDRSGPVPVASS